MFQQHIMHMAMAAPHLQLCCFNCRSTTCLSVNYVAVHFMYISDNFSCVAPSLVTHKAGPHRTWKLAHSACVHSAKLYKAAGVVTTIGKPIFTSCRVIVLPCEEIYATFCTPTYPTWLSTNIQLHRNSQENESLQYI
jgi:hypothetical protein